MSIWIRILEAAALLLLILLCVSLWSPDLADYHSTSFSIPRAP